MQRRNILALASILVIGLFIAVLASSGASAATGCSNHSLQGSYGFAFSGSVFNGGNEVGDFAVAGRHTFNGQGGLVGTETDSFNGQAVPLTDTGTYTVNADCTGTATIQLGTVRTVHVNIVVVDDARQVKFVDTDPGVVLAGTWTK